MSTWNAADIIASPFFSALLGVVSIGLTLLLAIKGLKSKDLVYAVFTEGVIEPASSLPGDVSITFGGKTIPRLMISSVFIWNRGYGTIRRADIAEATRVKVDLTGEVLAAGIVFATRAANKVKIDNGISLGFDFEYLDRKDGFIIRILHTGARPRISIDGAIMEMPKGIREVSGDGVLGDPDFNTGLIVFAFVAILLVAQLFPGTEGIKMPWLANLVLAAFSLFVVYVLGYRIRSAAPIAMLKGYKQTETAPVSPQISENKDRTPPSQTPHET